MPELGYEKTVRKQKDLGLMTYTDEQLPYGYIYKGAWKGTVEVAANHWWQIPSPVSGHVTPAGQQMKMLFLRVSSTSGAVQFAIVQRSGSADAAARGVTDGTIDYPYLEGAGAEVLTGSMTAPLHVTEGTLDFYINAATALTTEYDIAWWGCEAPPTIQS